jgi:lipocalin-like protein
MAIDALVGSWKLVSCYSENSDGEVLYPFGEHPVGMLLYGENGTMCTVSMRVGRPKFATGDMGAGTPEEIKVAFEGCEAYCGTFTIDESASTVTHRVEASRFPNWEGSEQVRYFELLGNKLRIYTPSILGKGKMWVFHVVWERR